jgi:rRNA-processing protein FCF1
MARLRPLFGPAFEAARRALRELDADQVPNDLRPVVAASGDLPPHLERVLMRALDKYEWLREQSVAAWAEADPEADGAAGASALLLVRPPGWAAGIAAAATEATSSDMAGRIEALEAERDAAWERLDEAKRRHKAAEEERARLERERAERLEVVREDRRVETAAIEEARRAGEKMAASLRTEIDRLRGDVEALGSKEQALREQVRSLRHDRAELTRRLEAATTPSWAEDPVELAQRIDELALMAAPAASAVAARRDHEAAPAELPSIPAGIRPDRGESITWLLGLAAPATVLVDGYNVGNPLGADPPAMRAAVEVKAEALARGGPHRVVVVYDSAEGPDDGEVKVGGGQQRIDIRFTPPGVIADDVIADLVAGATGPTVVITSDRELSERAHTHGALPLMSEALRDWTGR